MSRGENMKKYNKAIGDYGENIAHDFLINNGSIYKRMKIDEPWELFIFSKIKMKLMSFDSSFGKTKINRFQKEYEE